jgi:hypothetical protein
MPEVSRFFGIGERQWTGRSLGEAIVAIEVGSSR